ncbi:MAG: hypothetical protein R3Y56_11400 [Akkermansia sp.]
MARRRARKGGKKGGGEKFYLIAAIVVGVLIAGVLFKSFFGSPTGKSDMTPTEDFSVASYRQDGSRFAAVGNRYVLKATVESVITHGSDRLVVVSLAGNKGERLPLFLPASNQGRVNITRGDQFLFEVSCKTGRTDEGDQVKGVLVIQNVESV